ncbi:predicted protein [Histoplasma capsulatum G186AR]|uniref:Uncharacterized protein n=1 Tax=Ajellomyces capsulatus (strain G186AR / H82 / ATCC MYA-2454 / RMSCC 2432) TaxID=447093 RepID=C0NDE8_AJECG|nr:uncharacterized protein HCBG_01144 [Histoplasma capsulatum G186AR]EEH11689.1 predicted protein [Histoplasma capsulatum G186AR]
MVVDTCSCPWHDGCRKKSPSSATGIEKKRSPQLRNKRGLSDKIITGMPNYNNISNPAGQESSGLETPEAESTHSSSGQCSGITERDNGKHQPVKPPRPVKNQYPRALPIRYS